MLLSNETAYGFVIFSFLDPTSENQTLSVLFFHKPNASAW
jgi:hypothetical protein